MSSPNAVLERWNTAEADAAAREILPCCGSMAWAEAVTARRPFSDPDELFTMSNMIWQNLGADDWREAFDSHPRIGQSEAKSATAESLSWSQKEQSGALASDEAARQALADANRDYEARFGRIFIVRASGRSAAEILAVCQARMQNDPTAEMLESAEQQRQITQQRLRRWLNID